MGLVRMQYCKFETTINECYIFKETEIETAESNELENVREFVTNSLYGMCAIFIRKFYESIGKSLNILRNLMDFAFRAIRVN